MDTSSKNLRLDWRQRLIKRSFDFFVSLFGLICFWWLILFAFIAASIDTRSNGFFVQERIGKNAKKFSVVKIKTMRKSSNFSTTVTTSDDPRITRIGSFFRKTKIDELPQLWNVFTGDMSFVGPRPDVPGFADMLKGTDLALLSIRPGITGPATLKYRNEEQILANKKDPESYNRDIIFPDKVRINLEYIRNWSFKGDLQYILNTIIK